MSEVTEYQEVAAITCMDIDILAKVAEDDRWTKEDLKELIFRLKKNKDKLISDDTHRKMRYNAFSTVVNTAGKE